MLNILQEFGELQVWIVCVWKRWVTKAYVLVENPVHGDPMYYSSLSLILLSYPLHKQKNKGTKHIHLVQRHHRPVH